MGKTEKRTIIIPELEYRFLLAQNEHIKTQNILLQGIIRGNTEFLKNYESLINAKNDEKYKSLINSLYGGD